MIHTAYCVLLKISNAQVYEWILYIRFILPITHSNLFLSSFCFLLSLCHYFFWRLKIFQQKWRLERMTELKSFHMSLPRYHILVITVKFLCLCYLERFRRFSTRLPIRSNCDILFMCVIQDLLTRSCWSHHLISQYLNSKLPYLAFLSASLRIDWLIGWLGVYLLHSDYVSHNCSTC